jgi:L-seryl-tRNA(Ser) seleniumtransferase
VQQLKKHLLVRALRADKLDLAALSNTLLHYIKDEAVLKVPVWQMISMPADAVRERAARWQAALGRGRLLDSLSTIGGGSLPEETLPTTLLVFDDVKPNPFLTRLRCGSPAVIGRVEADCAAFDPRTVLANQDEVFLQQIQQFLS